MGELNWNNLIKNKCPYCGKDFMDGLTTVNKTLHHPCGFRITEQKYSEIAFKIMNKKIKQKKWQKDISSF